jgi:sec-independent protein translocase protein TatA
MGDVAKGIKSFKKGMTEDDQPAAPATDPFKKDEPKAIDGAGQQTAQSQPGAQVNKVG